MPKSPSLPVIRLLFQELLKNLKLQVLIVIIFKFTIDFPLLQVSCGDGEAGCLIPNFFINLNKSILFVFIIMQTQLLRMAVIPNNSVPPNRLDYLPTCNLRASDAHERSNFSLYLL